MLVTDGRHYLDKMDEDKHSVIERMLYDVFWLRSERTNEYSTLSVSRKHVIRLTNTIFDVEEETVRILSGYIFFWCKSRELRYLVTSFML